MKSRLLFLPGAGGDPDFWRPVGDRLPQSWDKQYLGWPGLGRQPPDPLVQGLNDLVDRVEAQMGAGPVDLIAQSLGGLIAIKAALRHPDRVRRLVLAVTSAGLDLAGTGAADWRADYARAFPQASAWVRQVRADLSGDLHRLDQPVLLLWGDADPISPLAVGERLLARLARATLRVVPGGDHDLVHNRAAEVAPIIETHLA